jgi:hypothetical protein
MSSQEKFSSYRLPRPPAFIMDSLIENLISSGDITTVKKITSIILKYQKKCCDAEIEMIEDLQQLF